MEQSLGGEKVDRQEVARVVGGSIVIVLAIAHKSAWRPAIDVAVAVNRPAPATGLPWFLPSDCGAAICRELDSAKQVNTNDWVE
jgi:hypothetical protein